jgi:uncharacterized Ntn-hydrolase superfamily protein
MPRIYLLTAMLAIFSMRFLTAQDTFSIVAVDTVTGEIGSAGASCLDNVSFPGSGGAIIISDILPGRGAIHTQSYWVATNQTNARARMQEGLSPEQIINWLKSNDANGPFGALSRQYGIVDFSPTGQARSAAYTGSGCLDWKGQRTGVNYAIQGNILLGPAILDSMQARFLAAEGPLADRLMAALQGANVPGADSRCLSNGTSSLSAFLRVAKPDDDENDLYLDLNVPSLPPSREPIDSLQTLYDQWKTTSAPAPQDLQAFELFPNPASGHFFVQCPAPASLTLHDLQGRLLLQADVPAGRQRFAPTLPKGLYILQLTYPGGRTQSAKLAWE